MQTPTVENHWPVAVRSGKNVWMTVISPQLPPIVAEVAAGRPVRLVWENDVGGLTFQIGVGDRRQFVKWCPAGSGLDVAAEVMRLAWASRYATVPCVLDEGTDEKGAWIVTAGLPGESAVDDRWKDDPGTAVRAIGAGLRALHEALPVADCPFDSSAEQRLNTAQSRAADGRLDPANWHEDNQSFGPVERALEILADIPTVDRLVVCHGDACAPNTLIGADGKCAGHVDLGALGVADRWADLAVATWSTQWNYGPGWEQQLLDTYKIDADPERIAYYRLLWDLAD